MKRKSDSAILKLEKEIQELKKVDKQIQPITKIGKIIMRFMSFSD